MINCELNTPVVFMGMYVRYFYVLDMYTDFGVCSLFWNWGCADARLNAAKLAVESNQFQSDTIINAAEYVDAEYVGVPDVTVMLTLSR